MTMSIEPPRKLCGTCGGVLNAISAPDGSDPVYLHGIDADHPAAPVSPDEATMAQIMPVCDFCSTLAPPDEVHTFECPDFEDTSKMPPYVSRGAWAACPACRDLILAKDQEALIERSLSIYFANRGHDVADLDPMVLKQARKTMAELQSGFFNARSEGEWEDYPGIARSFL